jgi:hypothetical protein
MTKDELLATERIVHATNGDASYIPLMELNKFFESNVCIPKGANPHIDADELHKWVEEPTLDIFLINSDGVTHQAYDIKAYQMKRKTYTTQKSVMPTYEWKWVVIDNGTASLIDGYYSSEDFWDIYSSSELDSAYAIEDTKRIRK